MVRHGIPQADGPLAATSQAPNEFTSFSSKITPEPKANTENFELPSISSADLDGRTLSFFETFGPSGILMALVTFTCILWTIFLMVVTINPNATANYLMDTAEFDNGEFWLINEPNGTLMTFSVLAFGVVVLGYLAVLVEMAQVRVHKLSSNTNENKTAPRRLTNAQILRRWGQLTNLPEFYRKCLVLSPLVIATHSHRVDCLLDFRTGPSDENRRHHDSKPVTVPITGERVSSGIRVRSYCRCQRRNLRGWNYRFTPLLCVSGGTDRLHVSDSKMRCVPDRILL